MGSIKLPVEKDWYTKLNEAPSSLPKYSDWEAAGRPAPGEYEWSYGMVANERTRGTTPDRQVAKDEYVKMRSRTGWLSNPYKTGGGLTPLQQLAVGIEEQKATLILDMLFLETPLRWVKGFNALPNWLPTGVRWFHAGDVGLAMETGKRSFHIGTGYAAYDRITAGRNQHGALQEVHEYLMDVAHYYTPGGRILSEMPAGSFGSETLAAVEYQRYGSNVGTGFPDIWWNPEKMMDQKLAEQVLKDKREIAILMGTDESAVSARQELLDQGYQVVPYINSVEDAGSLSFIILDDKVVEEVGVQTGRALGRAWTGNGAEYPFIAEQTVRRGVGGAEELAEPLLQGATRPRKELLDIPEFSHYRTTMHHGVAYDSATGLPTKGYGLVEKFTEKVRKAKSGDHWRKRFIPDDDPTPYDHGTARDPIRLGSGGGKPGEDFPF